VPFAPVFVASGNPHDDGLGAQFTPPTGGVVVTGVLTGVVDTGVVLTGDVVGSVVVTRVVVDGALDVVDGGTSVATNTGST
jgi:hypothetical protein